MMENENENQKCSNPNPDTKNQYSQSAPWDIQKPVMPVILLYL